MMLADKVALRRMAEIRLQLQCRVAESSQQEHRLTVIKRNIDRELVMLDHIAAAFTRLVGGERQQVAEQCLAIRAEISRPSDESDRVTDLLLVERARQSSIRADAARQCKVIKESVALLAEHRRVVGEALEAKRTSLLLEKECLTLPRRARSEIMSASEGAAHSPLFPLGKKSLWGKGPDDEPVSPTLSGSAPLRRCYSPPPLIPGRPRTAVSRSASTPSIRPARGRQRRTRDGSEQWLESSVSSLATLQGLQSSSVSLGQERSTSADIILSASGAIKISRDWRYQMQEKLVESESQSRIDFATTTKALKRSVRQSEKDIGLLFTRRIQADQRRRRLLHARNKIADSLADKQLPLATMLRNLQVLKQRPGEAEDEPTAQFVQLQLEEVQGLVAALDNELAAAQAEVDRAEQKLEDLQALERDRRMELELDLRTLRIRQEFKHDSVGTGAGQGQRAP